MTAIWTNLDVENLHSVNGPVDHSGLSQAQRLGITCGRRARSELELQQALKANGLAEGTEDWTDALRSGRTAMRLTMEREARTMSVLGKDDEFVPDEDSRAAATLNFNDELE
ncbi:MAG: hypothetical protein JO161_06045 [Planctomycetaceae bacterium]|nr:hypothetical protein [Planctomycetaceae bacterium]